MKIYRHCLLASAAAAVLIAPVCAQTVERRATFTGGGGNDTGKCTIEVYVDGSTDVEIRGQRGFLRTLSGQPAQWRRFECSGPMPTNPSDVQFRGVDGRGRQELIQDPRSGRGAVVVRIQDPKGGAEGYTFDLTWRGGGFESSSTSQSRGGRDYRVSRIDATRACQNAVREKANQQYGLRDIDFRNENAEDNWGRYDTTAGFFDARWGNRSEAYRFSCSIDSASGRVRGVDITQAEGVASADRYRYAGGEDTTSACQRAAEQRIERDGYRNVQVGRLNTDNNRRNDRIAGTATAQRGNNGRSYNFDVRCSIDRDNGNVRSLQVNRQ